MVNVTNGAAQFLKEIKEQTSPGSEQSLRLVESEDGFALTYGGQEVDDQVVEADGQEVLRISRNVSDSLSEATIDTEDTPQGQRLVIAGPGQPQ